MEERAVGGKEKKYVLYTVVNDNKGRTGLGVWIVRILLGTLLLVALAVVPYVSLRLAQENDRTLVVFQPFPVHNHTRGHHYRGELHASLHGPPSHRLGNGPLSHMLKSAPLSTTELPKDKMDPRPLSNATIVTLHESAVTLALLEDVNNVTHPVDNLSAKATPDKTEQLDNGTSPSIMSNNTSTSSSIPLDFKVENDTQTNTGDKASPAAEDDHVINIELLITETAAPSNVSKLSNSTSKKAVFNTSSAEKDAIMTTTMPVEGTSIIFKALKGKITTSLPTTTSRTTITTSRPVQKYPSTKMSRVAHKLAYVATASSGNHVGGLCVWKTNKNVTKWSYFYDNIPIEFQSQQDNTDHEMRAVIAAVRLWYDQWFDYHVVIRSHHSAIKGSKHPTRVRVTEELEQRSEEHFTYELEYRLGRDDTLVKIAYCLARLHKNYDHWFKEFENKVDELLGPQEWSTAKTQYRVMVSQDVFATDTKPERGEEFGDFNSLAFD